MYRSFSSLFKLIPLFDAIVSGIVFLISLSDSVFLVYGNATVLCMILSLAALLIFLVLIVLQWILGFLQIHNMSPVNSNSFTSSLPFGMVPFLSFVCLIVLARTSSSVLNKSGKVGFLSLHFTPPHPLCLCFWCHSLHPFICVALNSWV